MFWWQFANGVCAIDGIGWIRIDSTQCSCGIRHFSSTARTIALCVNWKVVEMNNATLDWMDGTNTHSTSHVLQLEQEDWFSMSAVHNEYSNDGDEIHTHTHNTQHQLYSHDHMGIWSISVATSLLVTRLMSIWSYRPTSQAPFIFQIVWDCDTLDRDCSRPLWIVVQVHERTCFDNFNGQNVRQC